MRPEYMGKMVDIVVTGTNKYSLMGEPVSAPVRPDVPDAHTKGQVTGMARHSLPVTTFSDSRFWLPAMVFSCVFLLRAGWILWQRR